MACTCRWNNHRFSCSLGRHRSSSTSSETWLSREEFVATFGRKGSMMPFLGCIRPLQFVCSRGRYAVSPDDSYGDVLHEGAEDIDDDAEHLLKRLRLQLPAVSEPRMVAAARTVRDMVLWLDWIVGGRIEWPGLNYDTARLQLHDEASVFVATFHRSGRRRGHPRRPPHHRTCGSASGGS